MSDTPVMPLDSSDPGQEPVMVGDVVQIDPASDPTFGGQFLVVTEVKTWGVQGYCLPLERREKPITEAGPGLAYYRCTRAHFVRIGIAAWGLG